MELEGTMLMIPVVPGMLDDALLECMGDAAGAVAQLFRLLSSHGKQRPNGTTAAELTQVV